MMKRTKVPSSGLTKTMSTKVFRVRPKGAGSLGSPRSRFPGWIPRALKQESGRTDVPLVSAHIRVLGTDLSKEERTFIRQKLGAKLGKFAHSIERVSVRVKDVNGPRGGIDQVCRIKVVLSNLPSVVVEAQDASLDAAISKALAGTERAVRRSLQRRRMKPIKVGARSRARLQEPSFAPGHRRVLPEKLK